MTIKVVIENAILRGSAQAQFLQNVATVYEGGDEEYKVMAPPKAKGPALEWAANFSVRQTSKEEFHTQFVISGDKAARIIGFVVSELRKNAEIGDIWNISSNPSGRYCAAQICLNGHVMSCNGDEFDEGERCARCGEAGIDSCPRCGAPIRGKAVYASGYERPAFCHKCGRPYPWMKDRLDTAKDLLDHDDKLTLEEREHLWSLLKYVMTDPKSDLAPAKRKLIDINLQSAAKATREFILDFLAKLGAEMSKP